jgi:hypothetical protein
MSFNLLVKQVFVARKIFTAIVYIAVPALLFYGVAILILTNAGFTTTEILRDPAQQTGLSSFLGFISNIGVWLWVSSVAICCFSLASNYSQFRRAPTELIVLLAMLSMLLAVDDFFLLHERYVYQKGIFLFYAISAITLFSPLSQDNRN